MLSKHQLPACEHCMAVSTLHAPDFCFLADCLVNVLPSRCGAFSLYCSLPLYCPARVYCCTALQVFALTFLKGYRPLVFHLPFWAGIAFGVVMQISNSPCCKHSINISGFKIGSGTYNTLLGFNVVSTVACWGLGLIALLDNRKGRGLEGADEDKVHGELPGGKAVHDDVHGVKSNSLLGLPVPRFLQGGRKKSGRADSSSSGSATAGDVKDVGTGTVPPAAAEAGGSGQLGAAAPAPGTSKV